MKTIITSPIKSCQVTVELSIREARTLKALVQNPITLPEDESDEMKQLREELWDLATSVLTELGTN